MQHLDVILVILVVAAVVLQWKSILLWWFETPITPWDKKDVKEADTNSDQQKLIVPTNKPEPVLLGSSPIKIEEKVEAEKVEEVVETIQPNWNDYDVPTYKRRGVALAVTPAACEDYSFSQEAMEAFAMAMVQDDDEDLIYNY